MITRQARPSSPNQPDPEGTSFGKYKVLRRIGSGGMAEIFKCRLSGIGGFDKTVVVKRMLPELLEDAEFVRMFLDEARISANLSHPNIVQIYEIDQIDDIPYIAMEYVRGPTLARMMREGEKQKKPGHAVIARVMSEICSALHYAHQAADEAGQPMGIIHRDVSPHNVLVSTEGVPKLLDFGVAKARGRLQRTNAGTIKGKLRYMSPEQFSGAPIDARVDVFGVGACLYQAVTGKHAYGGESEVDVLKAAATGTFDPPSKLNPEVDPELERIVLWAMAPDPAARCPDAQALHDALTTYVSTGTNQTTPYHVRKHIRSLFGDIVNSEVLGLGAYSGEPISSRKFSGSREQLLEKIERPDSVSLRVDLATERRKLPSPKVLVGAGVGLAAALALIAALVWRSPPAPGPTPVSSGANATAYLDEAERQAKQGRYKTARELLGKVQPTESLPPLLQIRAAMLADVIERDVLMEEARRLLAAGDLPGAQERASRALLLDAEHVEARRIVGLAQEKPRAAQGTPPAIARKPEPGKLAITAEPSARLFLDGEALGLATTFKRTVSAGTHSVRAQAKGYAAEERTVKVAPGAEVKVALRLNREKEPGKSAPAPQAPAAAPAPEVVAASLSTGSAASELAPEPSPAGLELLRPLTPAPKSALAGLAPATPTKAEPELEGPISSCPEEAQLQGAAPPRGTELWCALPGSVRHGKFIRWYANGNKAETGEYRQGKKNGRWVEYYENGGERDRTEWRRGVKSW